MGCETTVPGSAHHIFLPAVQVAGSITAGDLAQRFKLATDLVLSMVSKHLGTRIHGRLDGQLLHTDAYIARIKARVGASVLSFACIFFSHLHLLQPPTLTLLAFRPNWMLCAYMCSHRLHFRYTQAHTWIASWQACLPSRSHRSCLSLEGVCAPSRRPAASG